MDANYHYNQITQRNIPVYSGQLRQRGSGIGSLIGGVSSFVIPLAKKYALPIGRSFLRNAAPELLDVLAGKSKPRKALKRAALKTVKQQIGGGKKRTARKTQKRKTTRVISRKVTARNSRPKKTVNKRGKGKQQTKRKRKANIFFSVLDAEY